MLLSDWKRSRLKTNLIYFVLLLYPKKCTYKEVTLKKKNPHVVIAIIRLMKKQYFPSLVFSAGLDHGEPASSEGRPHRPEWNSSHRGRCCARSAGSPRQVRPAMGGHGALLNLCNPAIQMQRSDVTRESWQHNGFRNLTEGGVEQQEAQVLHTSHDRLFFSYVVAHQNIHPLLLQHVSHLGHQRGLVSLNVCLPPGLPVSQTDVRMHREIQGSNRLALLFCACRLRRAPLAIKFVTNTTKESKSNLLARLQRLHFDVQVECQRVTFETAFTSGWKLHPSML